MKADVIAKIRRFIAHLEDGRIFTTRDVLQFGKRWAVDKALQRLVFAERIRRLTRGVFVKDGWLRPRQFSYFEIAAAKARAFGRKILEAPTAVLNPLSRRFGEPACDKTFYIDGHSSTFKIGNDTITFKHTAARKRQLAKTKAGETARVLWHLGRDLVDAETLKQAAVSFRHSHEDKNVFRKNIRWMPAWLSDLEKFRPWDRDLDKKPHSPFTCPLAIFP